MIATGGHGLGLGDPGRVPLLLVAEVTVAAWHALGADDGHESHARARALPLRQA
jgi:hypothetical protein